MPTMFMELGTAALFLLVGWRYGLSGETVVGIALASFLLPLAVIDLKTMLLPDRWTYSLLGVVAGLRLWLGPEPWLWYVMGCGLGAGFLLLSAWISPLLMGKEGMGRGDVKLMAGIGLATGLDGSVIALFLASLFGILFGLLYRRYVCHAERESMDEGKAHDYGEVQAKMADDCTRTLGNDAILRKIWEEQLPEWWGEDSFYETYTPSIELAHAIPGRMNGPIRVTVTISSKHDKGVTLHGVKAVPAS